MRKILLIIGLLIISKAAFSQLVGSYVDVSDSVKAGDTKLIPTGVVFPDQTTQTTAAVTPDSVNYADSSAYADTSSHASTATTSDTSSYALKSDSSTHSDTATYAMNASGSTDSLYHKDSETWLSNGDTIPLSDSVRQDFTATEELKTPLITDNGGGDLSVNADNLLTALGFNVSITGEEDFDLISYDAVDIISDGSTLSIDDDSVRFDGSGSSNEGNFLGKNFFARIGGFFGNIFAGDSANFRIAIVDSLGFADGSGYITGIDTTGYLEVDSLSIGGGDVLTSSDTITLKVAVESESFDSIQVEKYIRWNASEGVHEFVTAKEGVVWQGALEDLVQVYNNTGVEITNGRPCYFSGSVGDTMTTVGIAAAGVNNISFIGLATGIIPNNDWGYVATRGKVRGIPISGLSIMGAAFLSADSTITNEKPAHPNEVIIVGVVINDTDGNVTIYVSPSLALKRQLKTKSASFTSQGIGAGTFWKFGSYEYSDTDANLTQAASSVTFGTADIAYEAHPYAIYGGAGSVTGGGRVALITTGTSYNDVTGGQTPADVDTLINDITNVVLNGYNETKKYLGTVTYQLVVVEGAPTAYSLDFNYGYAKYDDINDRNFYLTGLECTWLGDGTDATDFDVTFYKHSNSGWTYAATGFEPGGNIIAQLSVDHAGFLRVSNGVTSAWKRTSLNEYIEGYGEEGFVAKIETGANSTIQVEDLHVEVAID